MVQKLPRSIIITHIELSRWNFKLHEVLPFDHPQGSSCRHVNFNITDTLLTRSVRLMFPNQKCQCHALFLAPLMAAV
jgi:hypothetical protein